MNRHFFSAMARAFALLAACALMSGAAAAAGMNTQSFEFVSAGKRLSGFVDMPAAGPARAMILIVPGYGKTDVAGRTSWYDLRSLFTSLGIATVIWDKPGCGKSEGSFDADQSVESSAVEVADAAAEIRKRALPGATKIGLWGISRAGWIAPLAIRQDPGIAFWISVSGTDAEENFPYLLESNLRIEGRTEAQVTQLVGEWRRGFEITSHGGSFEDYMAATQALRRDPFMIYFSGGSEESRAAFLAEQANFTSGAFKVDKRTGLMIYVPSFDAVLGRLNIPVLALFGEKDRNVNWRSTTALYARTIGRNPRASLTIRTFPDGNHNLQIAPTGGLREMIEMTEHRPADGYHEAMVDWLRSKVLN
jgi:pimeloyl-ACP methyl ester carboxylesterase